MFSECMFYLISFDLRCFTLTFNSTLSVGTCFDSLPQLGACTFRNEMDIS